MGAEAIFEPLALGPLTVKNRVLRSSVAGRFDNYDGSGTPVRVNWDLRFARGGVGAIISSNAPIHARGSIVPGYAHVDSDETIPFWRELGERVREAGCPYILQIVHAGRERIVPFLQWDKALSLDRPEPLNGFPAEAMTVAGDPGGRRDVRGGAPGGRRRRAWTASRSPARTGCCRPSSSPPASTTARTPTAGRWKTGRASGSRSCAPSARRSARISAWATRSPSRSG